MFISSSRSNRIGVIAGAGPLPAIVAREAGNQGFLVLIAGLDGFVDESLANTFEDFERIHPGRLSECIKLLKKSGAQHVLLAGHIDHRQVFDLDEADDLVKEILAQPDKRAESLLGSIVAAIEASGLEVADMRLFLGPHLAAEGRLGSVEPDYESKRDLDFAWPIAVKAARLNIGQSMMVRSGVVVAVEAVEGTDETIRRGGALAGSGTIMLKLPTKNKDPRFDLPVVGSDTVKELAEVKSKLLAVAARQTIIIDPEDFRRVADASGIAVIARDLLWKSKK